MSVLLLKVTKPFCNPLWWMQGCVCGINFIFEIEVLCSIACWVRSEPPLKVCINCISWMMTRCSESVTNIEENFKENCLHQLEFDNGDRAHYIIESKVQWKPFWLATQQYPQNDWLGGNFPYTMTYAHGPHWKWGWASKLPLRNLSF